MRTIPLLALLALVTPLLAATTPPAVTSIIGTPPMVRTSGPVEYTVTFDRDVTGVDASDFTVIHFGVTTSIAGIIGSGATYVVTINATGSGNLRLQLRDNDSITDGATPLGGTGTRNGDALSSESFIIYPHTVVSAIDRQDANPTTARTVTYTVTFSRAVRNLDASDFAVIGTATLNGSIASITPVSTSVYTVVVDTGGIGQAGTIRLDFVDTDGTVDTNGHPIGGTGWGNGDFAGQEYTIERVPHVTSIHGVEASPTHAGTVHFDVVFDAPVSGVDATDFTVAATGSVTASMAGVTGSQATYRVAVDTGGPGVAGTLRLDFVDDDSVLDGATPIGGPGAGNGNFTGPVRDILPGPMVLAITPRDPSPTTAPSVSFQVSFSDAVTGVDVSDFVLTAPGLTGSAITSVSGGPIDYTVTARSGVGVGTLRLDVVDDDTIAAGPVPLGGAGSGNGAFSAGASYAIEREAPVVTSITRTYPSPTQTTNLGFYVSFSRFVQNVDANDFAITTTGTIVGAEWYIEPGPNGGFLAVTYVSGEGTIRVDVRDDATIETPGGIPLAGGFTAGEAYAVDRPGVVSFTRAGTSPTSAPSVAWTLTFTEPVTGVDPSDFGVCCTHGTTVTEVSGSGAVYTVTASSGHSSGVVQIILMDDDSIVDSTGVPLGAAGAGTGNVMSRDTYTIDHDHPWPGYPVRTSANPAPGPTATYRLEFLEEVTGVDVSDFSVDGDGVTGATVVSVSGSGTTYDIVVSTGSGQGTIRLRIVDDDSIADLYGNVMGGPDDAGKVGPPYWVNGATIPTPANVRATWSKDYIMITWEAFDGAYPYSVRRSTTPGGPYVEIGLGAVEWWDPNFDYGTTYYYVVSAADPAGPNSEEVAVRAIAPEDSGIVISQVFAAGGESGSPFRHDFVELFNGGSTAYDLAGWTLQLQSTDQTYYWTRILLNGVIEPGGYFLIQLAEGAEGAALPVPDRVGYSELDAAAGHVALVASQAMLEGCGGETVIDSVGFGTSSLCHEHAAGPSPASLAALLRENGGCVDTNDNSADFSSGAPAPRNSSSPINDCAPPPPPPSAPSGLTAIAGNGSIALDWIGTASSYEVKRSMTSGGPYTTVVAAHPLTSYTDSGVTNGIRYYYVVAASSGSADSNEATALPVAPIPGAPQALVATAGDAQVALTWLGTAAGYDVKRATTSGGPYTTIVAAHPLSRYTDTSVTNGVRYYYVVATSSGSADSNEATALPAAPSFDLPQIAITAPGDATTGIPFLVTVEVLHAPAYAGTIHFTSTAPGTLPPDYSFLATDEGERSFEVTLTDVGVHTITVSDGSSSATATIVVHCGAIASVPIRVDDAFCASADSHTASVDPVAGATEYEWQIVNGTITAGNGTPEVTFLAGTSGDVELDVAIRAGACPVSSGHRESAVRARPTAELPTWIEGCAGATVDVIARLTGTPPFVVLWSDGLQQLVTGTTAERTIAIGSVESVRIEQVTDAHCSSTAASNAARIHAEGPPAITTQPASVTVTRGGRGALFLLVSPNTTRFQWFQGERGDTSRPAGEGASLTTPPLEASTKYWVRVSNGCGHVDSESALVTVSAKRRATRS
jgi:hypothetical protein